MRHLFQKAKLPQAETPTPADAPPDPLIVDEPVDAAAPVVTVTDEGVPYEALDTATIVNRAVDALDARRIVLHLAGRTFHHVSDATDGAWVYRLDT